MSTKKIEILENTLLKLLIRRGSDIDRQNVILSEGELGFTTDTEKLYVGDGSTLGGVLVGNKFLGQAADHTTFTQAGVGDLAFNNTTNKLYAKTETSWLEIGGVYAAGDGSILVDSNNQITVGTLSAGNASADFLGNSLELDANNRVSLSGSGISTDRVTTKNGTYLELPGKQKINNVNYDWPAGGTGSNLFLRTDLTGDLSWAPATAPATFFFNSTGGPIPVGTIMPYVSAGGAPYGWLLCNGQEINGSDYPVLSAIIGESFGSGTPGTTFKVPDYNNSALYGVSSDPATSTTFSIASGTNSALSAQGSLFIIKAIPDELVQSSLVVTSGLTAEVNNVEQTGVTVSPLSGDIEIGLPEFYDSTQTIKGGTSFDLDGYGRVTSVNLSSTTGNTHPAGEVTAPNVSNIYNETSPIVFLERPVQIINTNANNQKFTIDVYPSITNYLGTEVGYGIAPDAKNIICESFIEKLSPDGGNVYRFIWSAPRYGLLGSANNQASVYEYLVGTSRASGKGDWVAGNAQVFLPLSASSDDKLQLAFRVNHSGADIYSVNVIGFTR